MRLHKVIYVLYLLLATQLNAQTRDISVDRVVDTYHSTVEGYQAIYNSKAQIYYRINIIGHPYLKTNEFVKGELSYDGVVYPDVLMKLDLYRDELVIFSPGSEQSLVLDQRKVDFAIIHGYRVVYLNPEKISENLSSGYYLSLYGGKNLVLEKQKCQLDQRVESNSVVSSFSAKSVKYFVVKDGVSYSVRNLKSVLNIFKSHKKELDRYVWQEDLSFRKYPEQTIVAIVKHYEDLTRQP